jgi:glycine oxidase
MVVGARMSGEDLKAAIETDVVVIGAGVIGLAIALELERRGFGVVVVERGDCMAEASTAAGGMLAVEDPHNPIEMMEFSLLCRRLYPRFLRRIEELSGIVVPFQTEKTVQYLGGGGRIWLDEHSVDPEQLAEGLMAAVRATAIRLMEQTRVGSVEKMARGLRLRTGAGVEISATSVVYAAGAWTAEVTAELAGVGVPVTPRKGQIMRVQVPAGLALTEVHRSARVYVMPRTKGGQAGSAIIGATVEDAGFDTAVRDEDIARLGELAAELVPEMGSAMLIEAWAGLRPAAPDLLPCIGAIAPRQFVASGHYRNGILWAPGTAVVVADLIEGRVPEIDVAGMSALRFAANSDLGRVETDVAQVGR